MSISEKEFKRLLQENENVSPSVRQKMDGTYQTILTGIATQKKQHRLFPFITAAILLLSLAIFSFSPLGLSTMNFLRFGQFTSEKLNKEGFVTQPETKVSNQGVDIQLDEIYADENRVGLHFKLTLPNNSPLLSQDKNDKEYYLFFAIKNHDNRYLFDLNTGLTAEDEANTVFGGVTIEQIVERETNTVELIYTLQAKDSGVIPSLNDTTILITRLSAYDYENPEKAEPGFSQVKGEHIEGEWSIPINHSETKSFESVNFNAENNDLLEISEATAYPTTFVIKIPLEQIEQLPEDLGPDPYHLKVNVGEKEERYQRQRAIIIEEDGIFYAEITFNYSGYDQYSPVYFVVKELGEIPLILE